MSVSGRKSKMTKGRLDGAVLQFSATNWTEDESKSGKDVVNLSTIFLDVDGGEYPRKFYMGDQRFTRVEDGVIKSVDDGRDCTISQDFAAGKLLKSIEDAAEADEVSKSERLRVFKILDDVEDASVLDGLWVKLKEVPSGSLKTDGSPFTDLLVDELVDAPDAKSGRKAAAGKSAAASATGGKKKAAKVVEEDEDEEEAAADDAGDEDEDDASDDPIRAAAVDAMEKILASLSTKTPLVKNFDSDAANGGITIKQAYTASFGVLKGKDVKGPGSNMINDPAFHKQNAMDDLYQFNAKKGIITPNE